MDNKFTIPPNPALVKEAEDIISRAENASVYDNIRIQAELNNVLNKIFEFREETFKQAQNYLFKSFVNQVTVTLNPDLEATIEKVFDCQQRLFKKHKTASTINIT